VGSIHDEATGFFTTSFQQSHYGPNACKRRLKSTRMLLCVIQYKPSRFGGTYCLHLQDQKVSQLNNKQRIIAYLSHFSTVKMKVMPSPEMSVCFYQKTLPFTVTKVRAYNWIILLSNSRNSKLAIRTYYVSSWQDYEDYYLLECDAV
jgi:hypothetical protein